MTKTNDDGIAAHFLLRKVLQTRGQKLSIERAAKATDFCAQQATKLARAQDLLDFKHGGSKAALEAYGHPRPTSTRYGEQVVHMGQRAGNGPLDIDGLASADTGQYGLVMLVDARIADDEIDGGIGGQIIWVAIRFHGGRVQLVGPDGGFCSGHTAVAESCDLVELSTCSTLDCRQVAIGRPGGDGGG